MLAHSCKGALPSCTPQRISSPKRRQPTISKVWEPFLPGLHLGRGVLVQQLGNCLTLGNRASRAVCECTYDLSFHVLEDPDKMFELWPCLQLVVVGHTSVQFVY